MKPDTFSPEYIQNKLFYFQDVAQKFHHDTRSFAEHKALDVLYTGVSEFKDDILEKIIGYQGGKRIGKLSIGDIPDYSHAESLKLAEGIKEFSYGLEEWAENKKYCDIENIAQGLSGLSAKVLYLLTLT